VHCPICQTTEVDFRSEASWMIPWEPYKDENGKIHAHNPNKHFMDYKCKNGHVFEETYFKKCLECGWQETNI
jgi:hypothetical protein